jgi:glycosyltransferase involved in cell wall biosynthesis
MKIILTVHQFFPDYFSGTEVLTFSVAKELLRRGHAVSVYTGYPARQSMLDAERFDKYQIDGIDVFRFHHAFVPMGEQHTVSEVEYNNRLSAQQFAGIVEKVKPDLVHFFHFSRLSAALVDVVHQFRVPSYYTPTDFWAVCPTSQLLLGDGRVCGGPSRHGGNCVKHVATMTGWEPYASIVQRLPDFAIDAAAWMAKSLSAPRFPLKAEIAALGDRKRFNIARLNALQGIVSPTKLMTKVLTSNGVKPGLITQSAYGIDVTGFDSVQREHSKRDWLTFGYIGTLAPHKGCHVLLEAFCRLANRAGSRLKIFGNPNDFPDYVAKLRQIAEGNRSIEFCGTFPNDRIAEVLSGIDALIVPSVWYENTPLVVYSALAAKCPVIASDFAGMSEVIQHEVNGLLFKPGDANALREQLSRFENEPKLEAELSGNCQPPKSIATYVDELLALYERSLNAPRSCLVDGQSTESVSQTYRYRVVEK